MKRQPHWTARFKWQQWLAVAWLLLLGIAAASSLLTPEQRLAPDLLNSNAPPLTPGHWLGTDPLGQDIWTVLLFGARIALCVSLPAALLAACLGTILGLLAGYWGNQRLQIPTYYWLAVSLFAVCYTLVKAPGQGITTLWWPLVLGVAAALVGKVLSGFRGLHKSVALPLDWLLLT